LLSIGRHSRESGNLLPVGPRRDPRFRGDDGKEEAGQSGPFPARGLYLAADPSYIPKLNGRIAGRRAARHERIFERSAPMRAETEAKANEIKQSLALLRRSL
jgi:hypothetical protein